MLHHIFTLLLNGDPCITKLQNPQSILDVGTGTGIVSMFLAKSYHLPIFVVMKGIVRQRIVLRTNYVTTNYVTLHNSSLAPIKFRRFITDHYYSGQSRVRIHRCQAVLFVTINTRHSGGYVSFRQGHWHWLKSHPAKLVSFVSSMYTRSWYIQGCQPMFLSRLTMLRKNGLFHWSLLISSLCGLSVEEFKIGQLLSNAVSSR